MRNSNFNPRRTELVYVNNRKYMEASLHAIFDCQKSTASEFLPEVLMQSEKNSFYFISMAKVNG